MMKRIIIADDSSTARMFIQRCLEISGYRDSEFIEANNGQEVIDILQAAPADLVITDINMPKMDGVKLLTHIKASPRLHNTPVMVITSTANSKKIEELKKLDAFAILSKPISPMILSKTLESLL